MFSVGMACYDDFNGVYFTVQNLLAHFGEWINEIIVVDNNPTGKESKTLKAFCSNTSLKVRYIPYTERIGTAAPRDEIFRQAKSEYVVCMDSHLVLLPGAFAALHQYIMANGKTDNLIHGPMVYDNALGVSTHFADEWRGQMWGTWGYDDRVETEQSFEIPAQGLGLFCARRESWLGFHPEFRGFGGEEWYIHEKYRQHGRKVILVSGLRWQHRFARPVGVPYPLHSYDRVRNYFLGLTELKIATDRMEQHFSKVLSAEDMEHARKGTERSACGCGVKKRAVNVTSWLESVAKEPSDINEHCHTLRDLAAMCDDVVDCGTRYSVSTIALAAGAKRLHVVALNEPLEVKQLRAMGHDVRWIGGDSINAPVPFADLIFIDTIHTAQHVMGELNRLAPKSRRYLALHDTTSFGHTGEDGQPGILSAVTAFITAHPEWTVIKHYHNNNGLLILSKDERDKKQPPPLAQLAKKFVTAVALHVISNPHDVDKDTYTQRLATCQVCELRNNDVCGECGCNIESKAKLAGEQCPVRKWLAVSAPLSIVHRSRWSYLKSALLVFWRRIMRRRN